MKMQPNADSISLSKSSIFQQQTSSYLQTGPQIWSTNFTVLALALEKCDTQVRVISFKVRKYQNNKNRLVMLHSTCNTTEGGEGHSHEIFE